MFKQPTFILLIAALALGAFFVAMWIWQPRMFPHHLAHSAHKVLRGALEMRGLSAPEDDDESVEATRCGALGNVPDDKCGKLNAPLDGSNKKNMAGLLECDRSETAGELKKKLRIEKFYQLRCLTVRVASREASAKRIEFIAADRLHDPVLVGGGVGMFLEHCPPAPHLGLSGGCLAVEYSRNGEVSRAVPLRLQAIEEANIGSAYNWKGEDHLHRQVDWPELIVRSVSPYPGGDLLVHLEVGVPFPHNIGVARVAQDGQPRWFREDYSLPWPHIIDDNLALVRSRRPQSIAKTLRVNHKKKIACYENWERHDAINLIDGRGRLLDEIDLLEALLESPYSILFERNFNGRDNPAFTNSIHRDGPGFPQGGGCNNPAFTNSIHHCRLAAGTLAGCSSPAFTNSIHQLGTEVSGANNIAPGDIVASLPFLNAFGIIDQNNRRFKELVQGSFIQQHAVRHLEKARFLMFDLGNSPRRLLMFDLATGKETILFPRDHTPTHLRQIVLPSLPPEYTRHVMFKVGIHLAVAPDRQRILFGQPRSGVAFELRLSDGRVLNIFRQLHDLSSVDDIPDSFRQRAWVFRTTAYDYANRF